MGKSKFSSDVLISVGGSMIARIFGLALLPIVTRIYSPEEIGVWTLLTACAAFFVVFATLRYELAVLLPKSDREAASLVWGVVFLTVVTVVLVCVLLSLCRTPILNLFALADTGQLVWVIPVSLFFTSINTIFQAWLTRKQVFGIIAVIGVLNAILAPVAVILASLPYDGNAASYIAGMLISQGIIVFLTISVSLSHGVFSVLRPFEMNLKPFLEYKVYLTYMAPYSLSGVIVDRGFLIALGAIFNFSTLGAFHLARGVAYLPVTLIAGNLRNVFFSHAAKLENPQHINSKIKMVLTDLAMLQAPIVIFMFFFSADLFILIFGHEWHEAGNFIKWIVLSASFLLLTSWLDRMFDVYAKQRLAVILQVGSDLVIGAVLLFSFYFVSEPLLVVAIFSCIVALYNIFWLGIALEIVGIGASYLWAIFISAFSSGAPFLILLTGMLFLPVLFKENNR